MCTLLSACKSCGFDGFQKLSCFRFVYETEHFNGVGELLEILGR